MAVLTAVVVILTVLVLVDLVLSGAIIRRLREIEAGGGPHGSAGPVPPGALPVGAAVPDFAATTVAGDEVTSASALSATTLVGFFSTTCRHCPDAARSLADRRGEFEAEGTRIISVLAHNGDDADAMVALLSEAGEVVLEAQGGPMASAFQVRATPSFLVLDGGSVTGSAVTLEAALVHEAAPVAATGAAQPADV